MSYCLLIPHYNHERQFIAFLPQLVASGLPCVIVDDGSSEQSLASLKTALEQYTNIYFFTQYRNRGKGAAVKAGFTHARALGFTHAIQIDADGQHDVADLPAFIAASRAAPTAIICGKPIFDDSAPKARVYGRKVTDVFVAIETLSLKIKDGLCGYRVYPLAEMENLLDRFFIGSRMSFDTDILVKAVWLNTALVFIKTRVIYPEQSISHFNYMRDNLQLIRLHTRLLLGMVLRSPMLVWYRLTRK